jgi:hypothetical protein
VVARAPEARKFDVIRNKGRTGQRRPDYLRQQSSHLLEALEALRVELGSVGEDIITIMRNAGVTPPEAGGAEDANPVEG